MCVVSQVLDRYSPLIPYPTPDVGIPAPPGGSFVPWGTSHPIPTAPIAVPWSPGISADELRRLLDGFKEALEAARTVDRHLEQPDCEDPEKAKLLARIDELERRVAALEAAPAQKRRPAAPRASKTRKR